MDELRRRDFLCPTCSPEHECELIPGEWLFPDYKETHDRQFRVCMTAKIIRSLPPYGWDYKKKGPYPVRWVSFADAMASMDAKRKKRAESDTETLDLSDDATKRREAQRNQQSKWGRPWHQSDKFKNPLYASRKPKWRANSPKKSSLKP